MKTITGIKSTVKPIEIDDTSSTTSVYVRSNIKEIIETDPVFGTKNVVYEYDEVEYSIIEWHNLFSKLIHNEIDEIRLAITETLDLLELILFTTNKETAESSYINILYANMIKRNLITIDKVPERYKAGVEKLV